MQFIKKWMYKLRTQHAFYVQKYKVRTHHVFRRNNVAIKYTNFKYYFFTLFIKSFNGVHEN